MNKLKKVGLMITGFVFSGLAMADGAAMAKTVDTTVKGNSEALWSVGGTIIVLSAIAMIISRIKRVTS